MRKRKIITLVLTFVYFQFSWSTNNSNYISFTPENKAFKIAESNYAANIYIDNNDWKGVIRATNDLGSDIEKVTGTKSNILKANNIKKGSIIVGTIGKSSLIDKLINEKKIDVSNIIGKWESFIIQTVDENLIVAGSDKRGTIYGIYDISEKIGVSPWYWWADVPVKKNKMIYVKHGRYLQESPKVKYRGIFINDEEPSFGQWARLKFGGINSKMYVHMFELLLRLKANYLWPAMWGKAFNEDDPLNPVLADEYGIIMGTSHHEPMMRAHNEYTSRKNEVGAWDYTKNKQGLDKFFYDGLERNKSFENLITIGMRGDGDVALSNGDDLDNMKVLRNVVDGQREIINKVYKKDPSEIPQMWAIFTEVQRYYDAGFTVPDDVLLLFCDNNWGYIRRTGPENELKRKGGLGMYYHIDMNGGPWNDRWINTTTIPKLREQFNLAYKTGIDRLWVVNVGDLKPKEIPIDFIMKYAWNPESISEEKTFDYLKNWAEKNFKKEYSNEIAEIVSNYPKYNLWRKPEVQGTKIFSIVNHHEADNVLKKWNDLVDKAEIIKNKIPEEYQDAFYQLVYYPAVASAGVAEMYIAAAMNNLYARQGRISANGYAKRAIELFEKDKNLSNYYNDSLENGKWKNMMQDVHIGYVQWSMPRENKLPELIMVTPKDKPEMGVSIEGSELVWPGTEKKAFLPTFDSFHKSEYYIDLFNKGNGSFSYKIFANKPWIIVNSLKGSVSEESRILVKIDWKKIPYGKNEGVIEIKSENTIVNVNVNAVRASMPETKEFFFGSLTGEFSIPSNKYNKKIAGKNAEWIELPDLGREESCMGIKPVNTPSTNPENAAVLEYNIYLKDTDSTIICLGILPTQDINPKRGLRIAVSINDEKPQIIDARKGFVDTFNEYSPSSLKNSKSLKPLPPVNSNISLIGYRQQRRNEIFDNIRWLDVKLQVKKQGLNRLKVYMIDPEIVLEKIVVNPDNKYPSYFGAPSKQLNPQNND